jgi:hypothetical protein
MSSVHYYAQRILNPYRGVRHCIEIENGNAVTTDGHQWFLYLTDSSSLKYVDHNSLTPAYTARIKFGSWSSTQGFKRAPLLSTVDNDNVESLGHVLLEKVKQYADRLPFPLLDHYELWMLDQQGLPIAILDSLCRPPKSTDSVMKRWTTGQDCLERFADKPLCSNLERAVKTLSHKERPYAWFQRCENGLVPIDAPSSIPLQAPELLLRQQWPDAEISANAREYVYWQAPYLLMLEDLSHKLRLGLEQAAAEQAALTATLYRLYPELADQSLMNRIRVQARLLHSGQ